MKLILATVIMIALIRFIIDYLPLLLIGVGVALLFYYEIFTLGLIVVILGAFVGVRR